MDLFRLRNQRGATEPAEGGWMDGGEQTLEKHKADEYEQIRITRARQPRRVRASVSRG